MDEPNVPRPGPPARRQRLRVAVLVGGPSAEHEVSLVSGSAILRALDRRRYAPRRVEIGRDRRWAFGAPDPAPAEADRPVESTPVGLAQALERLSAEADVVFIALHGPFGEDGAIQALLELIGLPYTGAAVAASAVGMDKVLFKRLVGGLGLPVVPWIEVHRDRWRRDPDGESKRIDELARSSGDVRLVIKPAALGSSVGVTLAHGPDERPAGLEEAFDHGPRALVEAYVAEARELEVAVLGSAEPEVFGPGEVFRSHELYDYADKYVDGTSRTAAIADLEDGLAARIREIAVAAYRAIGCEGMARVDFLAPPGGLFLSELNTIPGFTPISLYPKMVEARGIPFAELCTRLVELAMARPR